jgi:transposase InsO family protein
MNNKERSDIARKLKVLKYALEIDNVSKSCRYFGISRETYYQWKRAYAQEGEKGLINSKPCPENPTLRTAPDIEEKILYIRKNYYLGQQRISWYLKRYHDITVSPSAVRNVLVRYNLNRLPKNQRTRTIVSRYKRYEKQVPGHRIQVDVKFLTFYGKDGRKIRRFQYTAIDDATRIRALKSYTKHTQINTIDFMNYVINKFPFRIHTVQTDNGHEFQAKFHWHVEDQGIRHVYIRPGTPRLNGKVERSHGTDKEEFYQMMEYKNDVDLVKKIKEWENFYNYQRPHGGLKGKTPYEVLKEKLLG